MMNTRNGLDPTPAVGGDAAPVGRDESTAVLPSWFVTGLVAAVVWCATAGTVGIVLLVVDWYQPIVVGCVATVASVAAAILTARAFGSRVAADHGAALVAVGLVVAFFVLAAAFHSEHLLSDRDPALYIYAGRSIARTHHLATSARGGAFDNPAAGIPTTEFRLSFFPMLPVLLALGWSIGGQLGMLLVGPVLGSLALGACYALASRVVGPRGGLIALTILAVEPLQLWFSRDAYSELVVEVVVLCGLWLYLEARACARWGPAAIGGGVVATAALARVDALAVIAGVLALVALEWVRCDSDPAPAPARRTVGAFGGTLVAATLVALAISRHVSSYYIYRLGADYTELVVGFAATLLGLVGVVVIQRYRPGRRVTLPRFVFPAFGMASTAVFVWAYVWRPEPASVLRGNGAGRPVAVATRDAVYEWHYSRSLHWFSAYFGLVGIVVAFVGFAVLASRARRGNTPAAAVFLVVVPVAILYLARPSITPDQPWAMRRYLPVVIPGVAVGVAVAFDAAWRAARSVGRSLARSAASVAVLVVVLLVVIPTADAARPFVRARMQHGAVAAVNDICAVAGRDSAILVYGTAYLDIELPQTLAWFCGVPVSHAGSADLLQIARRWHALGRRLLVATAVPEQVSKVAPGASIVAHDVVTDDGDPERVFDRAPRRFAPVRVEIWVLSIPAIPT